MELLSDVPGALGGFTALGLLGWFGVRVMRQMSEDRRHSADQLHTEREQHAKLLAERDALISDLQKRLDAEREARWKAEDSAAKWRRKAGETT